MLCQNELLPQANLPGMTKVRSGLSDNAFSEKRHLNLGGSRLPQRPVRLTRPSRKTATTNRSRPRHDQIPFGTTPPKLNLECQKEFASCHRL